ncbi:hypothetical protein FOL47_001374 [Perkinsus chesapeaki]|uniref:Reverse transcriptase domain-containing protein n=1 Tax=Perkinsus chesapeaki TaxID=330153 RepID=A0A7J6KUP4_PERCH|nr:hypothetical protein FOL47_001374 [Perkinsus chesapeaki]
MLRCGCMAVSYAVIDVWSLADGFNYLMNCITKVAGQDGWSVALKYDEAVRSRWASSSIFDDSFNLHQAARQIDLECLIMVRSSLREGNKQEGSRFCFAFSKGGPGACKRPNCNYTHRCSICRSYKHGAAQHKKPPTEAASKSTPTEPVRLTANREHLRQAVDESRILDPTAERSAIRDTITKANDMGENLQKWRLLKLRIWELQGQSAQVRERNLDMLSRAPAAVQQVLQGKNLALFKALLDSIDYCDADLPCEMARGFDISGTLSSNGVYKPSPEVTPVDKDQLLDRAPQIRLITSKCRRHPEDPLVTDLWNMAVQDVDRHRLEGPYTRQQMDSLFGDRWLFSERFPKTESDKIREIDDLTSSMVNSLTAVPEKLFLDTIDDVIYALREAYQQDQHRGKVPRHHSMFRLDHAQAYRQCPTNPRDYDILAVRLTLPGCPSRQDSDRYFIHRCLPFGARASVHAYTRVSRAIVAVLRKEFLVSAFCYIDDFFAVCPRDEEDVCYKIAVTLNHILGFSLKQAKSTTPCTDLKLLGIRVRLQNGAVLLDIDDERQAELNAQIDDALTSNRLRPADAARLAGKLGFALTAFHGRNGRAFLRSLFRRANRPAPWSEATSDDDEIKQALQWFQWAIHACPRKMFLLGTDTPRVILYTDAEFSSADDSPSKRGCIGGVLATNVEHYSGTKEPIGRLLRRAGRCSVHCYVDSTVAEGCLRKGYSKCRDLNLIAKELWKFTALNNIDIWFDRVESAANPADLPSRKKWDQLRLQGWRRSPTTPNPSWRSWLSG